MFEVFGDKRREMRHLCTFGTDWRISGLLFEKTAAAEKAGKERAWVGKKAGKPIIYYIEYSQ